MKVFKIRFFSKKIKNLILLINFIFFNVNFNNKFLYKNIIHKYFFLL